jgi:hypothetical protein
MFPRSVAAFGVLLAAVPGAGYAVAYAYQIGYALQFNIPLGLISPQLSDVLAAAVVLAAVVIVATFVLDARMAGRQRVTLTPVEWRVIVLVAYVALVVAFFVGTHVDLLLVILVVLMFISLTYTLFGLRVGSGSWNDRLGRADNTVRESSLLLRSMMSLGAFWNLVVIVTIGSVVFAVGIGGAQARLQSDYLLLDGSPPQAVLAIYGDTIVLSPVDEVKHKVSREFTITKIGQSGLHLRLSSVGPLEQS